MNYSETKKQKLHLGESYYKPVYFLDKEELFKHGDEMLKASSEGGERGDLGYKRLLDVAGELDKQPKTGHFRPEYVQGQKAYAALLQKAGAVGFGAVTRLLGSEKQMEFMMTYSNAHKEFNGGSNQLTLPTKSQNYLQLKELYSEYVREQRKQEAKQVGSETFMGIEQAH